MNSFEKLLLKRVTNLTLSYLFLATLMSWMVELLGKMDFLLANIKSIFSGFYFSTLFLPSVIALILPFTFLFAAIQSLSSAQTHNEVTALHASGHSSLIFLRPLLLLAISLGMLSFYLVNSLGPKARFAMRHMVAELNADFIHNSVKEGKFQQIGKAIFIAVSQKQGQSALEDFFLIDQRNREQSISYYAKKAAIQKRKEGLFLLLSHGEIAYKNKITQQVSIMQFRYYTLELSEFIAQKNIRLYPKDLNLFDLITMAKGDKASSKDKALYIAELHKRLTQWLTPLIFALLASSCLSFPKPQRQKTISKILICAGLALLYYFSNYFLISRAQTQSAYIWPLYVELVLFAVVPLLWMIFKHYPILSKNQAGKGPDLVK